MPTPAPAEARPADAAQNIGKIYVLSIAIDQYRSPKVSNLQACVKDAVALKKSLQARFGIPEEQYLILRNEEATRAGILAAFRGHFGVLQDGDTALLHFSGHGSWEEAGPEFIAAELEPYGGRNEVLVVHDYGEPGVHNIADKELRRLISELQYPAGQPPRRIHFVGLMDCCFSGTIFREENGAERIRRVSLSDTAPRPLAQYLEGQYAVQYAETGTLVVPRADFALLSACGPQEFALENEKGGLFTQALVRALASTPAEGLTYAELYAFLRNAVQFRSGHRQNPYFEYVGSVHPFQPFLQKGAPVPPALPRLYQRGDQWLVDLGALHGLEAESWENTDIPLYRKPDLQRPVGKARLEQVGLEHALVRPVFSAGETMEPAAPLCAGLHGTPLAIRLDSAPNAAPLLERFWKSIREGGLEGQLIESPAAAYRVSISPQQLAIYRDAQLIAGISATSDPDAAAWYMTEGLRRIARWEQINNLRSPKYTSVRAEQVRFDFSWFEPAGKAITRSVFPSQTENGGARRIFIPFPIYINHIFYQIKVENREAYPSYYFLVHLKRDFGMTQKFERFIKPLRYEDSLTYDSREDRKALAITDPHLHETTDIFLLFVAREALHAPYLFEQAGFGDHYGKMITADDLRGASREAAQPAPPVPLAHWSVKRLEVIMTRT